MTLTEPQPTQGSPKPTKLSHVVTYGFSRRLHGPKEGDGFASCGHSGGVTVSHGLMEVIKLLRQGKGCVAVLPCLQDGGSTILSCWLLLPLLLLPLPLLCLLRLLLLRRRPW